MFRDNLLTTTTNVIQDEKRRYKGQSQLHVNATVSHAQVLVRTHLMAKDHLCVSVVSVFNKNWLLLAPR